MPLLQECVNTSFPPNTFKLIYPSQIPLHEVFIKLSTTVIGNGSPINIDMLSEHPLKSVTDPL